jgi:hypothetical protein
MNVNDIMIRDLMEAEKKELAADVVCDSSKRWPLGAVLMLVLCEIMALAMAFSFGYWKSTNDDLRRLEEQRQRDAQEARIEAEVRAMSNAELIAATERDAEGLS